jgi:hypothetical protein
MRFALIFALVLLARPCFAQTPPSDTVPSAPAPEPAPPPKPVTPVKLSKSAMTAAELQKTVDQLTQSNSDLLDLLKKQQAVLEDIQFDRRLQSRQIESLEERLTDTLFENTKLQKEVAKLEEDAALRALAPAQPSPAPQTGAAPTTPDTPATTPPPASAPTPAADETPTPPATYLPPPDSEGAPGTKSWHRLFTLKGTDTTQSDLFHVEGRTWRVLWHNQDKPGKSYANTSALFINAFPKDDTIPQKVCSKLGSGGDSTELDGPGTYFLKVEASGGSWELAVEDFR